MEIHPDDVLRFKEISEQMWRVAKEYDLPLRSITHLPMPKSGMANRMGDCSHTGDIRLVLRCTVDGQWCSEPMSPAEILDTAAHELAHLRFMHHGPSFHEFHVELKEAMGNKQVDHRQKLIGKLVKMQKAREGEAQLGNSAAAEAFAAAINRMLLENELSPSDLDYARGADQDPVIEIQCDLRNYPLNRKDGYELHGLKQRIAWQESLARVVANAHLCTFLVQLNSNDITFVGTKSHVTVCEYCYGNLVRAATQMSLEERAKYQRELRGQGRSAREEKGFRNAWLSAFVSRISERFYEVRQAAVQHVAPEGQSQALMRLSGALVKAQRYVDNKFSAAAKRYASSLSSGIANHAEGRRMGRINIGQKGVGSGKKPSGFIGS